MRKAQAYFYYYIGDLACRLSYTIDSEWLADKYQLWMEKSSDIQDKYNLPGPWKEVKE